MGIFGFGQGNGPTPQPPQQNLPFPFNMIQPFNNFYQTFTGNPEQQARQLLNSGQMTQEQFNILQNMYQQFGQFFRR